MNPVSMLSSYANQISPAMNQQIAQQRQKLEKDVDQVGKDLQSGSLSAAQSDFATVQQDAAYSTALTHTNFATAMNQLASDLKSGNLSGAQSDFATLQQNVPAFGTHNTTMAHPAGSASSSAMQLFNELGNLIQGGSLSAAYQAYTALGQELGQLGAGLGANAAGAASQLVSSGLSLIA